MKVMDYTFATAEENLACDEALLNLCEEGSGEPVLRFWEPQDLFVVIGYSGRVNEEVNVQACIENITPIFRRCSGGGAVLQGPGCLNYSVIFEIPDGGAKSVTETNCFVIEKHKVALERVLGSSIRIQGYTDLTLGNLKFSGNSQRRKKYFALVHGTFLLHFDFSAMEKFLHIPARRPDYRRDRPHKDFLTNLNIRADAIKSSLKRCWDVTAPLDLVPLELIQRLVYDKYSHEEWNFKF